MKEDNIYSWKYKGIVIMLNKEGNFSFAINNEKRIYSSLNGAKAEIDNVFKENYTFSKNDLENLFRKCSQKEKAFLNALIEELSFHYNNSYCELGLCNKEWDLSEIIKN